MSDLQHGISDADWIGHDDGLDKPKLLPCPFCGGEAKVIGNVDHGPFFVMCFRGIDCGCVLGLRYNFRHLPDHKFKTRAEAIAAWNKRG